MLRHHMTLKRGQVYMSPDRLLYVVLNDASGYDEAPMLIIQPGRSCYFDVGRVYWWASTEMMHDELLCPSEAAD